MIRCLCSLATYLCLIITMIWLWPKRPNSTVYSLYFVCQNLRAHQSPTILAASEGNPPVYSRSPVDSPKNSQQYGIRFNVTNATHIHQVYVSLRGRLQFSWNYQMATVRLFRMEITRCFPSDTVLQMSVVCLSYLMWVSSKFKVEYATDLPTAHVNMYSITRCLILWYACTLFILE